MPHKATISNIVIRKTIKTGKYHNQQNRNQVKKEKCKLCGDESILQESHLIPKSLYKTITQSFEPYDAAPLWVSNTQKTSFYSNKQITKKLLCKKCEDRFNKNGERYILAQCMKSAAAFELKTILDSSIPSVQLYGSSYFHPNDLQSLNTNKYLYFIASIAWRVSVIDWQNNDISLLYNSLPSEFMESLKRFLLEESPFPRNIYTTVCVDNDINPIPIMSLPSGDIKKNMHMSFFIPGVKFNIFFGEEADRKVAYHFNKMTTNILFMYRSFRNSTEFQDLKRLVIYDARPKGKLAKESIERKATKRKN